jgi:hypothetical protein
LLVTDKLRSYGSAFRQLKLICPHEQGLRKNNRAKNSRSACAAAGAFRERGNQHPAYDDYESLDRINDYTADYHHGEDPRGMEEPSLDQTELLGFVTMTLKVVNALPT